MSRRTRRTLWIAAALLALVAVAVVLRSKAPPEAARLLPECDGIVYVDLGPIRTIFHKDWKPSGHSPEYQQFLDAIGIDPERDIDQVAIALHRMSDPNGPNGPVAYSMVLVGKITGRRLNAWLNAHAEARESYAGYTVYSIPSEGRTVRVAQIGYDTVAISNYPTPEKIHAIIDRRRTAAWPLSGSTLLEQHYHDVPLLSLAWGMGQIGLPFSGSGAIHFFGLSLPIEPATTFVASLRWTGSLHVRIEEFAPSEAAAIHQAAALSALLAMARELALPLSPNPANNSLRKLLQTAHIAQQRDRVVLTAMLPGDFFAGL